MTPMTLTEQILARHADRDRVQPGDNIWIDVDVLMTHDVCGPGTIGIFKQRLHTHRGRSVTHGIIDFRGTAGDPDHPMGGIIELGGEERVLSVRCDVTEWDEQEAMVSAALSRFGRLDVAFANAGFGARRGFLNESTEHWRSTSIDPARGLLESFRTLPLTVIV